ncbi:MAG TPA: DinB family protein [Gemmatimonadales bacterium]|nr:DinB family protein [Gemmatimonadales bacterium]
MFTAVRHFLAAWAHESSSTARVLAVVTDRSLAQPVAMGHRTLGELAWHIVTSQQEILAKVGLDYSGPRKSWPQPAHAGEIHAQYVDGAKALAEAVGTHWMDDTLRLRDSPYGQPWPRGLTLEVMLRHEIHHRGQLTVLMRQAGLRVPGVYGPGLEEMNPQQP